MPAHLSQRCSAESVRQHAHCRAAICSGQCKAQFHPVQNCLQASQTPIQSSSLVQETPVTCRPSPSKSMLPRPPQVKRRHLRPRPCQKTLGRFSKHLKEQTSTSVQDCCSQFSIMASRPQRKLLEDLGAVRTGCQAAAPKCPSFLYEGCHGSGLLKTSGWARPVP